MRIFTAGVRHLERSPVGLFYARNHLAPNGTIWILRVDEIKEMRGNRERELVSGKDHPGPFIPAQDNSLFELLEIGDSIFKLPFPVIPEFGSDIGPESGGEGKEPLIGGLG
jgi:hypothetical protein